MEDSFDMFWSVFSIPAMAIIGGFVYMIVQTVMRARVRELEVRERIAMIERGLVPPPERDPQAFDRAMHRYDMVRDRDDEWDARPRRRRRTPGRYRSAGITIMGIGFGMMMLLTFAAGAPGPGLGVGGFLAVIGLAFFLNSLLAPAPDRYPPYDRYPPPPPPPQRSSFTDPPSN